MSFLKLQVQTLPYRKEVRRCLGKGRRVFLGSAYIFQNPAGFALQAAAPPAWQEVVSLRTAAFEKETEGNVQTPEAPQANLWSHFY